MGYEVSWYRSKHCSGGRTAPTAEVPEHVPLLPRSLHLGLRVLAQVAGLRVGTSAFTLARGPLIAAATSEVPVPKLFSRRY